MYRLNGRAVSLSHWRASTERFRETARHCFMPPGSFGEAILSMASRSNAPRRFSVLKTFWTTKIPSNESRSGSKLSCLDHYNVVLHLFLLTRCRVEMLPPSSESARTH